MLEKALAIVALEGLPVTWLAVTEMHETTYINI
jgi:hypothetical protein